MLIDPARHPAWSKCAVAVLAVASGVGVRLTILSGLGPQSPFITFYPFVMLAALGGGLTGGLLATLLSALTVDFLWLQPIGHFSLQDPVDRLTVGFFVLSGVMISFLTDAMLRARSRAIQAEAQVKLAKERERMEESLRRFELLAEHSRDIILYMRGDDGQILEANTAASRAYGYTREELLSLSIRALRSSDTQGSMDGQMADAGTAGILFETVHRRKDGSTFPVEVSSQGATINGSHTLISVIRDITERKRAEQALRESEAVLRSLFDSPDVMRGIIELIDGAIVHVSCNQAAAEMYGIERDSIQGRAASALGATDEVTRAWVPLFQKSQQTGEPVSVEYARRDATGNTRWLLATASYLSSQPSGNPRFGYTMLDFSQRKRVEEALYKQRQWLQVTLNSIGDAVLSTDAEGNITLLNPVAAGLIGWTEQEAWGQPVGSVLQLVYERNHEPAEDVMGRVLREARPVSFAESTVLIARDGREIPIEDSAAPILDDDGKLLGAVLVFSDVTAKRRSQEALRDSEAQFRALANAIPQLCRMAHADGSIFWYNQRWYDYTATSPEQMQGWGWQSVHDPQVLSDVVQRWAASLATGEPFDMVFPLRGADGVFRPFLTRVMPVRDRDGKVAQWFGTNTDISEQLRIEQALRESEARYRQLVELAPEALIVQQDGLIVYCNAVAVELYGADSREQLLGTGLFDRVHPDDLAAVVQRIHEAERGLRLPVREARHSRLDGSEIAVETTAGRVEWQGRPAMLVFVRDIADRKRTQRLLQEAQKMESIGLLAGGVAHDFNNLLVGVIGNASLAQRMLPADHSAVKLLDQVIKAGEQAAHLTRQMLAYAGKGRFVVEPLDLSSLIPDMSGLLRPSIPKKIQLHFDLHPDLPPVQADRGQLQQVFMNLTLNAAEAIGSHEGLITVRTGVRDADEGFLRLYPETAKLAPGKYVLLEVIDTGRGMDDATRARIFDPFFSTKFIGRGLGLAAVSGIVRSHQGAIMAASSPGAGSCLTVLLPAAAHSAVQPRLAASNQRLKGSGVILVVDDEQMVRELLKQALEHHGYSVLLADGGPAAIDVMRRHPGEIALVILDMSMPEMNGEETLPELRKIRPNTKVLVSSGYGEFEAMTSFHGQQVSGFIQKPYTLKGVAEKVKKCLE